MRTPRLDSRDSAAIREQIRALSAQYTPLWRFNEEDPDVGSVLALLFAEMFGETVERYNGILEHNFLHYLNALGGSLYPALPAQGHVQFHLVGGAPSGALVPRGEKVIAKGDTPIVFETGQDVLVTPVALADIHAISPTRDRIAKLYDGADPAPLRMFDLDGENLQERSFALSHDRLLWVRDAEIDLWPDTPLRDPATQAALEAFGECAFSLLMPEGEEVPLAKPERTGRGYRLRIDLPAALPETEWLGQTGRWLIARPHDAGAMRALSFASMRMSISGEAGPDAIYNNDQEQNRAQCYAFGQSFTPYDDLVIGCDEALCKPGASVDLGFMLSYDRVRIEALTGQNDIDWKLIMKRSDVRPEEEHDITVQTVMWEYWNGLGWARLFGDDRYADLFDAAKGEEDKTVTLSFTVPADMRPTLWGTREGFFIRARILRVHNALRTHGWYVSPIVENVRVSYVYEEPGVEPQLLARQGHMVSEVKPYREWIRGGLAFAPFVPWPHDLPATYFRFNGPLKGAPLRILFDLNAGMEEKMPPLRWECLVHSAGRTHWQPLNCMDGTDSMRKTGMLTFVGERDCVPAAMFGGEGWWLRLIALDDGYESLRGSQLPRVEGIYMNAAVVEQRDTRETVYHAFDIVEDGQQVRLPEGNLLACKVEIESLGEITRGELQALQDRRVVDVVRAADGTPVEAWVTWEAVDDLLLSGPDERHYHLDPTAGVLTFCTGRHGRMPQVGSRMRVSMSVGGGERGNLPAGAITSLTRQLGFIQGATNPLATFGGCEQETIGEAALRLVNGLRHQGRAVSAKDYEDLALQSSRAILRAVCYCDRDEKGLYSPGSVTLVFLQRNYREGKAFHRQVGDQVRDFIIGRAPGDLAASGRLRVVGPQFILLNCRVEAVVDRFDDVYAVQQEVKERLGRYLDPVSGNFDGKGWAIGVLPNTTQIHNAIRPVAGIRRIRRITMTAYTEDAHGRREVDLDFPERFPYCLPMDGEHDLHITVG